MPPASVLRPGNMVLSSCPVRTNSPPICGFGSCAEALAIGKVKATSASAVANVEQAFIVILLWVLRFCDGGLIASAGRVLDRLFLAGGRGANRKVFPKRSSKRCLI